MTVCVCVFVVCVCVRGRESHGKVERDVGTKGVYQNHLLSFDDNKVLKIINWIC